MKSEFQADMTPSPEKRTTPTRKETKKDTQNNKDCEWEEHVNADGSRILVKRKDDIKARRQRQHGESFDKEVLLALLITFVNEQRHSGSHTRWASGGNASRQCRGRSTGTALARAGREKWTGGR